MLYKRILIEYIRVTELIVDLYTDVCFLLNIQLMINISDSFVTGWFSNMLLPVTCAILVGLFTLDQMLALLVFTISQNHCLPF